MNNRLTITLSLAAILIASVFAGAGTFAYFSDTATSIGNTFTATTVHIYLENDGFGDNRPLYTAGDGIFYPGSGEVIKTLRVHNDGPVAVKISGFSAIFTGDINLADGLWIKISEVDRDVTTMVYLLYRGAFSGLEGEGVQVSGVQEIDTGGSVDLSISVWMPEDSTNQDIYQGLSMTADISVTAKQA